MAKTKVTPKAKPKKAAVSKPKTTAKPKTQSDKGYKVKKTDNSKTVYYCSFCKKPSDKARRIFVAKDEISICDECIEVCNRILFQDDKKYWGVQLLKIIEQELLNEPNEKKSKKVDN